MSEVNLYIFGTEADFTDQQRQDLHNNFAKVVFLQTADFTEILADKTEKVLALDPDITGWQIENDLLMKIPKLKAICLQTTGYEWVDGDFCREQQIILTNVPHYASISVAEKCIFMALALAKRYPLYQKLGKMSYIPELVGDELWNQPTDIIGFGSIGHALAERLEPLVGNKEICYYSHNQHDSRFHYWPFTEMLGKSEYMFITISKNAESLALFDDLSKFNRNMKIVVVSNGFEAVTERLVEKCERGELGGVAFESDDEAVLCRDYQSNIFVTPHNAHCTRQALENMFKIWTETIISASINKPINKVN